MMIIADENDVREVANLHRGKVVINISLPGDDYMEAMEGLWVYGDVCRTVKVLYVEETVYLKIIQLISLLSSELF
jgi:hypothetical protein